jgi:hypothetical protein
MTATKDPVVLFETHIAIVSAAYPSGERTRAMNVQFKAAQSTSGVLKEVEIPALLIEKDQLEELITAFSMALQELGGPIASSPAPKTFQ